MASRILYMILPVIYSVSLLTFNTQVYAQNREQYFGMNISVRDISVLQANDSLYIELFIEATDLYIGKDQSLQLNLFLQDKEKQVVMAPVVYTGTKRKAFDDRNQYLFVKGRGMMPYHVFSKIDKDKVYPLKYEVKIPYARWMKSSEIRAQQLLNDCCSKKVLSDIILPIENYSTAFHENNVPDPIVYSNMIYFVEPEIKEAVHIQHKTLRLNYKNGRFDIKFEYQGNRKEIKKLDSLLYQTGSDISDPIKSITIVGYASPEGLYCDNEILARNRSLNFRKFLVQRYKLDESKVSCHWVAENWDELVRIINKKNPYYKKQALNIIENVDIFQGRERMLMEIYGGSPYREMLKEVFPELRYVEIEVEYTNAGYPSTKIKERLYNHPEQLGLDDILKLAHEYSPYSNEYREIYEIAAKQFPDNEIVNNNTAGACLASGDVEAARSYLERVKGSSLIFVNLGVSYYIEGNFEMAKNCFLYAAETGNKKAKDNLLFLRTNE